MYELPILLNIAIGVVLILLIFYFYAKDNDNFNKFKKYDLIINDLTIELTKLKKAFREYEKGYAKISNIQKPKDGKVDYSIVQELIKKNVNTHINDALTPFLDSVCDIDISIKSLKGSVDSRLEDINEKIRYAVHPKQISKKHYDDKKIEELSKNGKQKYEIAKELNTNKGEVDFMLKMAKLRKKD
jgi:hypothetical protein